MKRTAIKRRPLADTVLATLEPEAKEYRELDGIGLYFRVKPDGGKSWQLRYKNASGKWSWIGIGSYPEVAGALARKKAAEHQQLISAGIDPLEQKRSAKLHADSAASRTFRAAAEDWYLYMQAKGLEQSTLDKARTYLDKDILPALGNKQLDDITRNDCANLQSSLEARGAHNVAKKARGWVNQIFGRAIAKGLTENDPASRLHAIAAPPPATKQQPHLLEHELPDFLRALQATTSRLPARVAAWLCLWLAVRPGMLRFAEWTEFDLNAGTWSVPADKMKMDRDYLTPLPTQAVAVLQDLQRVTGGSRWLFPGVGPKNPTISENTICKVYATIGYKGRLVGHGTRHTASTLLNEHNWPKKHIDAQLAHKEEGVSGVYNKAQYLEQRRTMLQWYADYLDALAKNEAAPLSRRA
ncbi:tyrosine-type recombinase/integrase [Pseudomonas anguilliseptica]|uniref:tyrosine-type recombinase/integrase n=1 Tax=Pseudomonas anguilliseptica TaxID=53406 RepID=UPI0022AF7DEC|nr:integrase arm-type DNA-binding domain-containing protein [Pseudomonas anguilliseptica]MCZ4321473.1 integrase arm-type DNA-binding domain-containing protein [Pseudomonas anguilliseptica]